VDAFASFFCETAFDVVRAGVFNGLRLDLAIDPRRARLPTFFDCRFFEIRSMMPRF
jgi:hypothetical protein